VAKSLGLSEADYGHLTLDILSVEEVKPIIDKMAKPPPVPGK
jgi:hypothetical protein